MQNVNPICNIPSTIIAALDLLVALCANCVQNFKALADHLTELYYSGLDGVLTDWEYQPPIGPRPQNGFVGLKNAGATCYMNSVLQQVTRRRELQISTYKFCLFNIPNDTVLNLTCRR